MKQYTLTLSEDDKRDLYDAASNMSFNVQNLADKVKLNDAEAMAHWHKLMDIVQRYRRLSTTIALAKAEKERDMDTTTSTIHVHA